MPSDSWPIVQRAGTLGDAITALGAFVDEVEAIRSPQASGQARCEGAGALRPFVLGTAEASYHAIEIPKKRGGVRVLHIPPLELRRLQRLLLEGFRHLARPHRSAQGFEPGTSIVEHARFHVKRRWVYAVDLQDFFPTIREERLRGMFLGRRFRASPASAEALVRLCAFRGALPQGAPTSPYLSNVIAAALDGRLFDLAREEGLRYTRYADDLVFSTHRPSFPAHLRDRIDDIIRQEGFEPHPEKRRLMPRHRRQVVTGLVVNQKVNLPRRYLRDLRALVHNVERFGWESQVGRPALFDDEAQYWAYAHGDVPWETAQEVRATQREGRLLLHPASPLPYVDTVERLIRVVRGRVALVGMVRGPEDPLYLDLRARVGLLAGPLLAFREGVRSFDPDAYTEMMRFVGLQTNRRREEVARWESGLEGLLSAEGIETPKAQVRRRLRQVVSEATARPLRLDPALTTQYLYQLQDPGSLGGLIHDSSSRRDRQGEVIPVGRMVEEARTLTNEVEDYLPASLVRHVARFLDRVEAWIRAHSVAPTDTELHPYDDTEPASAWGAGGDAATFKEGVIFPFKRSTRFGRNPSQTTRLRPELEAKIERLVEVGDLMPGQVTIGPFASAADFYSRTDVVLDGLGGILASAAKHAEGAPVEIGLHAYEGVVDAEGRRKVEYEFRVRGPAQGSAPPARPGFGSTKLKQAARQLAGYARYEIVAPFQSGFGRFDMVAQEVRPPRVDDSPDHFTHIVTFLRLE